MIDEAGVQSAARLEVARHGDMLWRNNVGVLLDRRGVPVRFGLLNDSAAVNKEFKSSDLIGIRRVLVTPDMVGKVVGLFWAVECKEEKWKWRGDEHEMAQAKFISLVNTYGGIGTFHNGGSLYK